MNAQPMTHDEAVELAGLYVLDALSPEETQAVDAHLANCTQDHSTFGELRAITPFLGSLVDPLEAPVGLKDKVMAAYRSSVAAPAHAPAATPNVRVRPAPPLARGALLVEPARPRRRQAPNWMGWAAAAAAIVLLVVVSVAGLNLRQQADQANQRANVIAQAVAALAAPGSQVAILRGSGAALGVNGFAAFPTAGTGYVVMTDVPAAPSGKTYQAWYLVNGKPTSAGTMSASNGSVVASGVAVMPGTDTVAVTIEPVGGSDQPTSDPIIVGAVTTRS